MKEQKAVDPYKVAAGDDKKFLAVMVKQSRLIAAGVSKMTPRQVRYWLRDEKGPLEKDAFVQIYLMGAFAGMWLAGANRRTILAKAKKLLANHVCTNFVMSSRGERP